MKIFSITHMLVNKETQGQLLLPSAERSIVPSIPLQVSLAMRNFFRSIHRKMGSLLGLPRLRVNCFPVLFLE